MSMMLDKDILSQGISKNLIIGPDRKDFDFTMMDIFTKMMILNIYMSYA